MPQQAHAPRTVCPDLEGAGKSFTGIVQGGMISSWTLFWMADVEVIRSQHHPPSGFDWSGVPGPVGRIQLLLPPSGGFSTCKTTQLYCSYSYPFEGNQDPGPRPHCSFLTAPPFSLQLLSSLLRNYSDLPIGRSWHWKGPGGWMKPISCSQEMGNTGRPLCPGAPWSPAQYPVMLYRTGTESA